MNLYEIDLAKLRVAAQRAYGIRMPGRRLQRTIVEREEFGDDDFHEEGLRRIEHVVDVAKVEQWSSRVLALISGKAPVGLRAAISRANAEIDVEFAPLKATGARAEEEEDENDVPRSGGRGQARFGRRRAHDEPEETE